MPLIRINNRTYRLEAVCCLRDAISRTPLRLACGMRVGSPLLLAQPRSDAGCIVKERGV